MPVTDQMSYVAVKDHLMAGIQFRSDNVDRLVFIRNADPAPDQFLRQEGCNYFGPLQTEDAVNGRSFVQIFGEFLCGLLGFFQTMLGIGHVNVAVNMAVAGGKMPSRNAERKAVCVASQMCDGNAHV